MTKNKVKLFVVLVVVVLSVSVSGAHAWATEQQGLSGKNASLFESEWVAQKPEDNKGGDHAHFAVSYGYSGRCIKVNIDAIPINSDVYVNEVYLGHTPLEYTIPIDSFFTNNDRYIFRIHKDGYRDERFEVMIDSFENCEQVHIFIDKHIKLQEIQE